MKGMWRLHAREMTEGVFAINNARIVGGLLRTQIHHNEVVPEVEGRLSYFSFFNNSSLISLA